jgi:hypothetical protein
MPWEESNMASVKRTSDYIDKVLGPGLKAWGAGGGLWDAIKETVPEILLRPGQKMKVYFYPKKQSSSMDVDAEFIVAENVEIEEVKEELNSIRVVLLCRKESGEILKSMRVAVKEAKGKFTELVDPMNPPKRKIRASDNA